jgi:hypothetical protein
MTCKKTSHYALYSSKYLYYVDYYHGVYEPQSIITMGVYEPQLIIIMGFMNHSLARTIIDELHHASQYPAFKISLL